MKYSITEIINTVEWNEAVSNFPVDLVNKAKKMANDGLPPIFGLVEGSKEFVVMSVNADNKLYVAHRAS